MFAGRIRVASPFLSLLAILGAWTALGAAEPGAVPLRVTTFRCDITSPMGQPMISCDPVKVVEEPLLAKGIVIESGKQRYVLCALDWCEVCNATYDSFRAKIAAAAGTVPAQVAVQTVHQHTAPLVDESAQKLLAAAGATKGIHLDAAVVEAAEQRVAEAVKQAMGELKPFDRIGTGQAKVDRVASHRRCRNAAGVVQTRWSTCTDPALKALPEGEIDPYLKTITLFSGEKPLVRLHYYATHPQGRYGDGRATSDFVGVAREKLERKEGVFQIYFTGCGGDVTVGKYNDGSDKAREELASQIYAGMEAAVAATKTSAADSLGWRVAPVKFVRRHDGEFSKAACRAVMENTKAVPVHRLYDGAIRLVFHERSERPIELTCLRIGEVRIVNLPGEPMVEFQRYAQKLRPEAFTAVAGYGDCGTGYICTAAAYGEGGYEPTAAGTTPDSERLVKKAIDDLLEMR